MTTSVNRLYDDTKLSLLHEEPLLASLQARARTVSDQLAAIRHELRSFNENQMQIVKLEHDADLQRAVFSRYATNLEQAKIDQALAAQRMSNISVAQPATFDPMPIAPKKPQILAIGVLLGLLGGIGVALLERLARSRDSHARGHSSRRGDPGVGIDSAISRAAGRVHAS